MSFSRCFLPFKVFGKLFNIAFFKHGRNRLLAQAETNFCLPADFGHFQTGAVDRSLHISALNYTDLKQLVVLALCHHFQHHKNGVVFENLKKSFLFVLKALF